jgi:hypothetical protein
MNKEVHFNKDSYQAEIEKIQSEIDNYKKCSQALEKITGSTELKTIEYINEFICALSKFPSVQKSAELLNLADEYNFLKDNLPNVKSEKSEISKKELELLKEKHTTRLSDELQKQYKILETIAKEYTKLSYYGYINCIRNTDYGVYSADANCVHITSQLVNR